MEHIPYHQYRFFFFIFYLTNFRIVCSFDHRDRLPKLCHISGTYWKGKKTFFLKFYQRWSVFDAIEIYLSWNNQQKKKTHIWLGVIKKNCKKYCIEADHIEWVWHRNFFLFDIAIAVAKCEKSPNLVQYYAMFVFDVPICCCSAYLWKYRFFIAIEWQQRNNKVEKNARRIPNFVVTCWNRNVVSFYFSWFMLNQLRHKQFMSAAFV